MASPWKCTVIKFHPNKLKLAQPNGEIDWKMANFQLMFQVQNNLANGC